MPRSKGDDCADLGTRLDRRTVKTESCWEWVGYKTPDQGYGQIAVNGKRRRRVHRVAYELNYGPVPPGLCVLHRCDNRTCVRPDHLFLGTNQDNSDDMIAKGRAWWQRGIDGPYEDGIQSPV